MSTKEERVFGPLSPTEALTALANAVTDQRNARVSRDAGWQERAEVAVVETMKTARETLESPAPTSPYRAVKVSDRHYVGGPGIVPNLPRENGVDADFMASWLNVAYAQGKSAARRESKKGGR